MGTSKGYLRFLTGSGVQKYLWQLGGEIVAMSSGKELLIVLHRDASENGLEYTVLDLESYEVLQAGKVPVTVSGGTICWLGFTEDDVRRYLLHLLFLLFPLDSWLLTFLAL